MTIRTVCIAFLLLMTTEAYAAGDKNRIVDPTRFDIGDIKLYMGGQEVVAALKKRFDPNAQVIDGPIGREGQIVVQKVPSKLRPGAQHIHNISYKKENEFEYDIDFLENVSDQATSPEVVVGVRYKTATSRLDPQQRNATQQQTRQEIYKKFGEPTYSESDRDQWCGALTSSPGNKQCDRVNKPYMNLNVYGCELYLIDPTYDKKLDAAYSRVVVGKKPQL